MSKRAFGFFLLIAVLAVVIGFGVYVVVTTFSVPAAIVTVTQGNSTYQVFGTGIISVALEPGDSVALNDVVFTHLVYDNHDEVAHTIQVASNKHPKFTSSGPSDLVPQEGSYGRYKVSHYIYDGAMYLTVHMTKDYAYKKFWKPQLFPD